MGKEIADNKACADAAVLVCLFTRSRVLLVIVKFRWLSTRLTLAEPHGLVR